MYKTEVQKKVYKPDEIEKELKAMENDILKDDDYIKNEKFLKFEKEYVVDGRVMQASWWIEKNLVGQERLKKIYGIYEMGVVHEYTDDELKDSVWMEDLADKYMESKIKKKDFVRTVKDVEQYFKRKDKSEEVGLIERLKKLGIDVDKFEGPGVKEQRVKLLHFLYGFEFKNKVELSVFLSNPSLENVDNRIAGDMTRNGELMAYLKNNVEKECDGDYIVEIKRALYIIADEWEKEIHCVKGKVLPGNDKEWFSKVNDDLEWLLGKLDETPVVYMDSLMETFYLKLSLHEMIGRERDMIRINAAEYKEGEELNEFQKKMFGKFYNKLIEMGEDEESTYKRVEQYVEENRKSLAQCVFGKESISGNDYRKFDQAKESFKGCLEFYLNNTLAVNAGAVPILLLISHIQEYISCNETLNYDFYRYQTKDIVSLKTELKNGKDALRISQFAWQEKVNRRVNAIRGMQEKYEMAVEVENKLDRLLLKVYACNSLWEVMYTAELMLQFLRAFISNREVVERRYDYLVGCLSDMSYKLYCEDRRWIYRFVNQVDILQIVKLLNIIERRINSSDENQYFTYEYTVAADALCTEKIFEGFLEVEVFVKNRSVDFVLAGVKLKKNRM